MLDFYDEKNPEKGYGFFKLKPLINSPDYMQKGIAQLSTIIGQTYVTEIFPNGTGSVGNASLHFQDDAGGYEQSGSYLSYANVDISSSLSNGTAPPSEVYFENAYFDSATNTFTGDISWGNNTFDGDSKWVFTMVFSQDLLKIESGTKECFDFEDTLTKTLSFN